MSEKSDRVLDGDERVLHVVSEGLRAGPGTVQWEEALREAGNLPAATEPADGRGISASELERLLRVRRHLEAGRNWREISAGDGFTRKLMGQIDAQGARQSPKNVAFFLASLALLVVLGVTGWAIRNALSGRPAADASDASDTTPIVAYGSPVWVWDFGKAWPARTQLRGALKVQSGGWGMRVSRPSPAPKPEAATQPAHIDAFERAGAAAVSEVELSSLGAAVIEVILDVPTDLDPGLLTQVFITSSPGSADDQLGVTEMEWLWQLSTEGIAVVTPTMEVAKLTDRPPPGLGRWGTMVVRIDLQPNGEVGVTANGAHNWSGAMGLEPDAPIYVGVRFLTKSPPKAGLPTVKRIRVLTK